MRISDWSSDVCSSDLILAAAGGIGAALRVDLLFAKRRDRLLRNQCGRIALNRLTAGQIGEIGKGLTGIGHLRTHLVRSEEHTSELQSLMRISYAVFFLNKKRNRYLTRANILTTL